MTKMKTDRFGLLVGLVIAVKKFSDKIRIEFGMEKCVKSTLKRGKLTETSDLYLDTGKYMSELNQENA